MLRDMLAVLGAAMVMAAILGAFSIGHFRIYYGDDRYGCTKMEEELRTAPASAQDKKAKG